MQRLKWRSTNVTVGGRKVHCLTFDQLLGQFDARMTSFAVVEAIGLAKATTTASPSTPTI